VDGALCGFAEVGFELRERLFDRVEVGAVGREDAKLGACDIGHAAAPCWSTPSSVRFAFVFDSVDEHQAVRVDIELALEPFPASAQNVGPLLFGRIERLFCA
jgi:hypothetical protein